MPGVEVQFDFWTFVQEALGIQPWMLIAGIVGLVILFAIGGVIASKLGKAGIVLLLIAAVAAAVVFGPSLLGLGQATDKPATQPAAQPAAPAYTGGGQSYTGGSAVAVLDSITSLIVTVALLAAVGFIALAFLKFRSHRAKGGRLIDFITGQNGAGQFMPPYASLNAMLGQMMTLEMLQTLRDMRSDRRADAMRQSAAAEYPYLYIEGDGDPLQALPWYADDEGYDD